MGSLFNLILSKLFDFRKQLLYYSQHDKYKRTLDQNP